MNIHNSLSNEIEELDPINDDYIGIYSCGPTVYDDVHIGNLSSFIYADTLARTLKTKYQVKHVMNITDVDDKTISRSHGLYPELDPKQALNKLTKDYETKFKSDISRLNIDPASYTFIRATESIELMQLLITKLLKLNFAYLSDDG
ncbi:MAG TPA: class I tRNA ligase family protein, partial [Candidatus Saccharimonadales bacterium]